MQVGPCNNIIGENDGNIMKDSKEQYCYACTNGADTISRNLSKCDTPKAHRQLPPGGGGPDCTSATIWDSSSVVNIVVTESTLSPSYSLSINFVLLSNIDCPITSMQLTDTGSSTPTSHS